MPFEPAQGVIYLDVIPLQSCWSRRFQPGNHIPFLPRECPFKAFVAGLAAFERLPNPLVQAGRRKERGMTRSLTAKRGLRILPTKTDHCTAKLCAVVGHDASDLKSFEEVRRRGTRASQNEH